MVNFVFVGSFCGSQTQIRLVVVTRIVLVINFNIDQNGK